MLDVEESRSYRTGPQLLSVIVKDKLFNVRWNGPQVDNLDSAEKTEIDFFGKYLLQDTGLINQFSVVSHILLQQPHVSDLLFRLFSDSDVCHLSQAS